VVVSALRWSTISALLHGRGHGVSTRHPEQTFADDPKIPIAIMGALIARPNLVRAMGPECRCAVRNATATHVGGVRAGCGV
jgi:hypothetical protein